MNCKMCELIDEYKFERKTKIQYEDKYLIVIPNINKGVFKERKLCIWKECKKELSAEELKIMYLKLEELRKQMKGVWDICICLNSHPEHFHMQLGRIE